MSGAILRDRPGLERSRAWIASELMYPELTSTGFYVAAIAERLGRDGPTEVVCAQPTYLARGTRAPALEQWRGVTIRRVPGTTFDKDRLAGRLANLVTFSLSTFITLLRRLRPDDVVLVLTNPPTLPVVVAVACWWRASRFAVLIHDLYPDTLVAVAGLADESLVVRGWRWLNRRLFARAAHIIVVGRDMKQRLVRHDATLDGRITVVANWGEPDTIRPNDRGANPLLAQLGIADRFVVLYAGNLGRPNDLGTVVEAADRLRTDDRFRFLVIGSGVRQAWLDAAVAARRLTNLIRVGPRPRGEQQQFLNACDVAVVPFVRGMWGVAVPSRLYNFLAAGKPVIGIAEPGSEIDLVVRETGTGWVTPPHDVDAFVAALTEAATDRSRLTAMGVRARRAAEDLYDGRQALDRYAMIVDAVAGRARPA